MHGGKREKAKAHNALVSLLVLSDFPTPSAPSSYIPSQDVNVWKRVMNKQFRKEFLKTAGRYYIYNNRNGEFVGDCIQLQIGCAKEY